MPARLITDLAEARRTVLRRAALQDVEATPELLDASARIWGERLQPDQVVERILRDVRERGDAALWELTGRLEPAAPPALEVDRASIERAYQAVPGEVVEALRVAAEQVRRFHERHVPRSWLDYGPGGSGTGQLVLPIERVGLIVPGGRASYPSTVVMMAVPARVAGCGEVVMCSPPGRDGQPPAATLVAADVCRVDRIFALGGAQAVGAMAFGTETVPRVDKIVGPGNVFVALAKRRVYGLVGIDQIAGPTETLIVADDGADPAAAAADMLAQAEHDPLASAILLATSVAVGRAVQLELERQLRSFERRTIASASLERNGGIVVTGSLDVALELANEYAPEHLALLVRDPWAALAKVRHAGGVFLGETSLEAVGDYTAGPSHVMPTGGTARFSSPLSAHDFVKITSVFALGPAEVARLGPPAAALARAEGLTGHAAAIDLRLAARRRSAQRSESAESMAGRRRRG
ncbi:MAG TPA: histidinol dehydrogenase [Chloroflexota bacterium]|jgi:histidinol dehydrogenase